MQVESSIHVMLKNFENSRTSHLFPDKQGFPISVNSRNSSICPGPADKATQQSVPGKPEPEPA